MKNRSLKTLAFTALVSGLAVSISLLTIPFIFGVNIHLFQAAIFIAAVAGGPLPGLTAGLFGGFYMASVRGDIAIIIGNGLLGLTAGLFARRFRPLVACLLAWFLIQLPWIFVIDVYLYRFPLVVVETILILLTVEDIISAIIVDLLMVRFGVKKWVTEKLVTEVSS